MMYLIDWAARVMDVLFDITVPITCAVGLWEMGELWLAHAWEQSLAELREMAENAKRAAEKRTQAGEGEGKKSI